MRDSWAGALRGAMANYGWVTEDPGADAPPSCTARKSRRCCGRMPAKHGSWFAVRRRMRRPVPMSMFEIARLTRGNGLASGQSVA